MQVAQKVGAADDLPEGVLFVDTPLPAAPRSRPAVIIALPFLALAVLIALLALKPADPPPRENPVVTNDPGSRPNTDKLKDRQGQEPRPIAKTNPIGEDVVITGTNQKALAGVLKDPGLKDRRVILLSGNVSLADFAGLGFEAGSARVRRSRSNRGVLAKAGSCSIPMPARRAPTAIRRWPA